MTTDTGPAAHIRQGTVESWDGATGNNVLRVAGGQLLNVPSLTAESASLQAGDVVNLLSAGNKWFLLGKVTTPGDPGTVPTWTADISALTGQVDTIQTVTIPAVQGDVTVVQGQVTDLGSDVTAAQTAADNAASAAADAVSTASTAQTTATNAQTAADAAQADVDALTGTTLPALQAQVDGILPITETDISDDAITTPKIAAGAITAAEIAALAVTTSALAANAVTAAKIAAGTITATELAAGAVTAAKIAAGTITGDKLSATAIDGKTITGSLIRTAASGQRIELNSSQDKVLFYSGEPTEDFPGSIYADVVGVGGTAAGTYINSPVVSGSPASQLILGSRSDTNSSTSFLYSDQIQLNGLNSQIAIGVGNQIQLEAADEVFITSDSSGIQVEGTYLTFNGGNVAVGSPFWLGYLSSAPAVPAASTLTTLTGWTTIENDGIPNVGTGVFTIPAGGGGLYRISGQLWWSPFNGAVSGTRLTQAVKTSGSAAVIASVTVDPPSGTSSGKAPALAQWNKLFRLAAGDTVIIRFQHTSSGSETNKVPTATTQDISFFQIVREQL
ncbi:alanine-zipper protein [Kribbella solani]|uniref:Uncharacterized protein n=1 Tax=Kribbella solani TaxID=236067 RepID=A0A841E070_9ACTN|nr:alanine-zipper protein [Kribbella solani]MBB5982415.1 hypothetical protein [Kribbella solani]